MDEKMLRDQLRRIRIRQKVTEVRVQPRVAVGDAEVRRYYEENFKNDFKVRVRMLSKKFPKAASTGEVARLQVKLRELKDRVSAGEDFGELAKTESEGSNPTQGGDIGWIMRGDVAEEIEALAFAMEKGQVSDPFRLGDGVHILQVTDREPLPPKAYSEVEDRIRNVLLGRAGEKEYQRWVNELRGKAFIEIRLDGPVPPE
jgi:parvulin-like peptidyl-prolyl isomerase